jgi:hypothetical protein
MEGGALRCVSEDRMTSELLPRKAPSRFTLSAHSKKLPMAAAARVVLAVPCLPQTGLPFRALRMLRGQKAAGNEPLKNGNGATARRSSIC